MKISCPRNFCSDTFTPDCRTVAWSWPGSAAGVRLRHHSDVLVRNGPAIKIADEHGGAGYR